MSLSTNSKRKRGRPKKKTLVPIKSVKPVKRNNENEEIIICLPIVPIKLKKNRNVSSINISMNENLPQDTVLKKKIKQLNSELSKKNIKIKKLEAVVEKYKSEFLKKSSNNLIKIKVDFIVNNETGLIIKLKKTKSSCRWCTHPFDNLPCYLPEKYYDDVFYVHTFSVFCSYNCVASWNMEHGGYNAMTQHTLINRLYNKFYNNEKKLVVAPDVLMLKKFNGPMTIEQFRANVDKKKYRIVIPPMMPIYAHIEELCTSDNNTFNFEDESEVLVLKRSKPLPNSENNIIKTMGIKTM